jgi:NDP-sugar pyrophosphorylase family protein
MQIIIPMSGFGERFRKAGYQIPKPLILVEGKPIIQHVVEMFSSNDDFIFICSEEHLDNPSFEMKKILKSICVNSIIIPISPHKLGPVYTVMQAIDLIDLNKQTIVNYCDFTCYWDYSKFQIFVDDTCADGVIPSYKGFHPHTLWSSYYAYLKEEDGLVAGIQEKEPFTNSPDKELASSGTYYFKTGFMMKKYFQRCISEKTLVNNEYYVSMAYKSMIQDGLNIYAYELEYFMQWGTPVDLHDYEYWSNIFREILHERQQVCHKGSLLMPIAGLGNRFKERGYKEPKPLISVSGLPMALQALNDLPSTDIQRFVLKSEMIKLNELTYQLNDLSKNASFKIIDQTTDGQATTCVLGVEGLCLDDPITIGACDNGMLYSSEKFNNLMCDKNIDVIVWGAKGYPGAIRSPKMYGWIEMHKDTNNIKFISVKTPLENPAKDFIVTGVFTFKKARYFLDAVKSMKSRKAKINGEYYVDMAINDAISLGYRCSVLEIDRYIGWGTPNELNTFKYWQSCFHKWDSHPYRFELDPNIARITPATN